MLGSIFGRLTLIQELPRKGKYERRFLCLCSCGNTKEAALNSLRAGGTASCGCIKTEMLLKRNQAMATHGMTKTPEYLTWTNIRRRCCDPKDKGYSRYGALGISVCKEWESFEGFFADMGRRPSKEHSIERLENSKGYSKSNCIWATRAEQSRNKSSNVIVSYRGVKMVLMDACEAAGINYFTVWSRIERGWSEDDLFKPVGFIPTATSQQLIIESDIPFTEGN